MTTPHDELTKETARATVLADDRVARISAVAVRITVALLWLENLSWKVPPNFGEDDNSGLFFFTGLAVEHPVLPPFTAIIENVVIPNFGFFAWGVYIVEICLGVFLLLGLGTRFWAVVGIAQALSIFLVVGASPNEWKWSYFLMIAAHVAVLGFAAGRVFGVDSVLRRRSSEATSRFARLYRLAS